MNILGFLVSKSKENAFSGKDEEGRPPNLNFSLSHNFLFRKASNLMEFIIADPSAHIQQLYKQNADKHQNQDAAAANYGIPDEFKSLLSEPAHFNRVRFDARSRSLELIQCPSCRFRCCKKIPSSSYMMVLWCDFVA